MNETNNRVNLQQAVWHYEPYTREMFLHSLSSKGLECYIRNLAQVTNQNGQADWPPLYMDHYIIDLLAVGHVALKYLTHLQVSLHMS